MYLVMDTAYGINKIKKYNLLIIAYANDYPTEDRPIAGPFVKEFIEQVGKNYNCKIMLVERRFVGIGVTSQLRRFGRIVRRLLGSKSVKDILVSNSPEDDEESIIRVTYPVFILRNFPLHFLNGITSVRMARKALIKSRFKPDIMQTFKSFPPAYIAWKLKRKFHAPVVNMEYQGPFSSYEAEPHCMGRAIAAIKNIDRTVHTKYQIEVIKAYGIPSEKLGLLYFGINTDEFIFNEEEHLERKVEAEQKRFKLLIVGRIEEEKGFKYLINAINMLVTEYPNIQLSIVGPKGNCFEWVMNSIKILNLQRNVKYLGIVKQRRDVSALINKHHILIIASLIESQGMTMLEALSCGKPVVATRCGGPQEIINKDNGILVAPCDSNALAYGIREIMGHYAKYHPWKIREFAVKTFGYGVVCEKIHKLYEELIDR